MTGSAHPIEAGLNGSGVSKELYVERQSHHDGVQVGLHELFVQVHLGEEAGAWWVEDDVHVVQAAINIRYRSGEQAYQVICGQHSTRHDEEISEGRDRPDGATRGVD